MKKTKETTKPTKLYDYLLTGHFSNGRIIQAQVTGENETMAKMLFNELPDVKQLQLRANLEQYSILEIGEHDEILDNGRFVVGIKENTVVAVDMKHLVSCIFQIHDFENTHRIIPLNNNQEIMEEPITLANVVNGFAEYLAIYKSELL